MPPNKSDQDIIRLQEVHFPFRVHYGVQGQGAVVASDMGNGELRLDLIGWHTVMVTPRRGKNVLVSWAGCHGSEWVDCAVKGCALFAGHEPNTGHADKGGKGIVVPPSQPEKGKAA